VSCVVSGRRHMQSNVIVWSDAARLLLRTARTLSRELGHYEIITPVHLFLALLTTERPGILSLTAIQDAMLGFDPPWPKGWVVMSPGAKTPSANKVLAHAVGLASEPSAVEPKHIRAALEALEPELVRIVLCRLNVNP
jgi:hypothetical protein